MLDKLKDLNNLRKAQSEIKKQLESIYMPLEKGDISVLVRGDKRIEKIEIDGESQDKLVDVLNEAMKKVDKKVEKKMRGQLSDLGIDLPGM